MGGSRKDSDIVSADRDSVLVAIILRALSVASSELVYTAKVVSDRRKGPM